jgi:hypothetical protein
MKRCFCSFTLQNASAVESAFALPMNASSKPPLRDGTATARKYISASRWNWIRARGSSPLPKAALLDLRRRGGFRLRQFRQLAPESLDDVICHRRRGTAAASFHPRTGQTAARTICRRINSSTQADNCGRFTCKNGNLEMLANTLLLPVTGALQAVGNAPHHAGQENRCSPSPSLCRRPRGNRRTVFPSEHLASGTRHPCQSSPSIARK